MSLSNNPKTYGVLAVVAAFGAGILFTLTFGDIYHAEPALFLRRQPRRLPTNANRQTTSPVALEDRTEDESTSNRAAWRVPRGLSAVIGKTPLIELPSLTAVAGQPILVKLELLNAAGNSPKDRVALSLIEAAERAGALVPGRGDAVYEGTSGSTGISIAALARARGYTAHICMDTDQSADKVALLRHLGATVERVAPAPISSPGHYVNVARARAAEHAAAHRTGRSRGSGFFADQFESSANWRAHFTGTGPEIYEQCGGRLAAFVAGAGTGGTIAGVAAWLKEACGLRDMRVVLADPHGSGLYNSVRYGVMYSEREREGTRRRAQVDSIVEGIGINRVTSNFARGSELIDDALRVSDAQAATMARWLVEREGLFVGSSSAVNCVAAVVTALRLRASGVHGNVVTLLCDSGARHLSKFWKQVGDMGLEHDHRDADLLALLGYDSVGEEVAAEP
jgi:cysteine synthase A